MARQDQISYRDGYLKQWQTFRRGLGTCLWVYYCAEKDGFTRPVIVLPG